jgi:hypothetical protein
MVEHFVRNEDGDENGWKVFIYLGTNEVLKIDSIKCRIKLAEIYDRIEFSRQTLAELADIINN